MQRESGGYCTDFLIFPFGYLGKRCAMQDKVATPELELVGKVRCNYTRGIVSFEPDRSDALRHQIFKSIFAMPLIARSSRSTRDRINGSASDMSGNRTPTFLYRGRRKKLILKNGERLAARYL